MKPGEYYSPVYCHSCAKSQKKLGTYTVVCFAIPAGITVTTHVQLV